MSTNTTTKTPLYYFTFIQNNSGGFFDGPHHIIVEAPSADEANRNAVERGGIYFDGVKNDIDCSCCGDRWYRATEHDQDPFPEIHGERIILGHEHDLKFIPYKPQP